MTTVDATDLTQFTAAELANPETDLGLPDFLDRRTFAVSHTYTDRHSWPWLGADDFEAHQPSDGPSYVVVGANVSDERINRNLAKLRQRYGNVTFEKLQAARAGQIVMVRDASGGAT